MTCIVSKEESIALRQHHESYVFKIHDVLQPLFVAVDLVEVESSYSLRFTELSVSIIYSHPQILAFR